MTTTTIVRIVSCLAAMLAATVAAQPPRPLVFEGLRIKRQDMPVYPYEMIQLGVKEGQVCIAFSIDATGKVDDSLAIAYTHPEFARVALAAVRRWTFEPARLGGDPIATATDVTFNFEVEGPILVSLNAGEALSAWMRSMHPNDEARYPRTLRELDRIPTPVLAPSPAFPSALSKEGREGTVTVNFYIDEAGAVRLPAVEKSSDPDLATAAVTAIQAWKFEPPTCRGERVLTKASQVFRFRPSGTKS